MAKDQIIIVSNREDPHTDDVIVMLQEMGHEAIRLNTNDIPLHVAISLAWGNDTANGKGTIAIRTNGRVIDREAIRSVWWRRPNVFPLPLELSEQEREFAREEIDHTLRSLWSSLDCYWISYPEYIRQARWKGQQLQRAAQLGFDVPRTLITTDPEEARAFYHACAGQVVFKVMTDPFLGAPKVMQKHPDQPAPESYMTYTTKISEAELSMLDSVRLVPCMFQEYIPKQVELRVTIIGDDIFAAEIHSQAHEKTQIDWRHYDVDIPYRKANLPADVAERCFALVKSYHLNFSAMDLILTPDGRYVFIENNPNGQFIFVEERVPELRMTEALASCLIRGANS
jgi:glutathione synthase/RimK-type ligase-like ATP-grasp enzyme